MLVFSSIGWGFVFCSPHNDSKHTYLFEHPYFCHLHHCILIQASCILDDHKWQYIGTGKNGKPLIPFTIASKGDCTCLNTYIYKQWFSLLLMHGVAANTMFLGTSSESYLSGSSDFVSKLLTVLQTVLIMLLRSTLPCFAAMF